MIPRFGPNVYTNDTTLNYVLFEPTRARGYRVQLLLNDRSSADGTHMQEAS